MWPPEVTMSKTKNKSFWETVWMHYFCPEKLTSSWTEPSTSVFKITPTSKKSWTVLSSLKWFTCLSSSGCKYYSSQHPTSFWIKLLAAHTQPFSIHYRNTLCYSFLYALCHWCNGKRAKDCEHTGCAEAHLSLSLLYLQMDIMIKKHPTEGFMHHSELKKSVSKVSRHISAIGQRVNLSHARGRNLSCLGGTEIFPLLHSRSETATTDLQVTTTPGSSFLPAGSWAACCPRGGPEVLMLSCAALVAAAALQGPLCRMMTASSLCRA